MSNFSEKLRLLIDNSGVAIYQLAKKSGLDRTTIQRSISGERLPSISFVEQLADYLRLSPAERTELFDLYSISKVGEKVYYGRKYIKDMIERLATIHSVPENNSYLNRGVSVNNINSNEDTVYEGTYLVNNMIRTVLEDEVANNVSPEINVSVPITHSFLLDLLYQLYLSEAGNISIKYITRFYKKNAYVDSNNNLEILSHVIPFAYSSGNSYELYYYYDNFDIAGDIAIIMPFYIITGKHLITLSSDFGTAILYSNESIINIYKKRFHAALNMSTPLIDSIGSCDDLISSYINTVNSFGEVSHIVEPQPCFAWYYTSDMIKSHLQPDIDNREIVLELLHNLYQGYQQHSSRPISIFSYEALALFANTGILADLPQKYAIPFSLEERILLLNKLKIDTQSDIYRVYVTNSSKFIIPNCSIQLYGTGGIAFFASDNHGAMTYAYVTEKSVNEAFYDFFESLPESDLIFGKDDTIQIIESIIKQCEKNFEKAKILGRTPE